VASALVVVVIACSSSPPGDEARTAADEAEPMTVSPKDKTPKMPATTDDCIARITVDGNDSVLDEQRSVGPRADDFFEHYEAHYIDPDTFVPVKAVARYKIGDTPLLWFTADKSAAVVNAAVLTTLTVADATRMGVGERALVGQLTELGRGKISGRDLVEFLIHARVIATYVHIGAELCLRGETDTDGHYTARFTGEHTYFTNEENVDEFAFDVTIAGDGHIAVTIPS
jgi:hypothetical protein